MGKQSGTSAKRTVKKSAQASKADSKAKKKIDRKRSDKPRDALSAEDQAALFDALCRWTHGLCLGNLEQAVSSSYTDILRVGCFWESHSRSGRTRPCFHLGQHVRVMFSLGSEHMRPCVQFGQRIRGHLFIRVKTYADLIRCRSARARPVWRFYVWLGSVCRL